MKKKSRTSSSSVRLRKKAETVLEEKLRQKKSILPQCDVLKLVHELEVHQVELEMQNEELKIANKEISYAAGRLSHLFDASPSGFISLTEDSRILDINQAAALMLGKEKVKLINSNFRFFVAGASLPLFNNGLKKISKKNKKFSCEIELNPLNKPPVFALIEISHIPEKKNWLLTLADITERKLASGILAASEANYRTAIENAHDLVWNLDASGKVTFLNKAARKAAGMHASEIIGKDFSFRIVNDDIKKVSEAVALSLHGKVQKFEAGVYDKNNRVLHLDITQVPIVTNGKVTGINAFGHDITLQKKLENELLQKEQKLRSVLQTAMEAVIMSDESLKITFWNTSAEKMFGYKEKEILGKPLTILMPGEFNRMFGMKIKTKKIPVESGHPSGVHLKLRGLRKDGTEFPIEHSVSTIKTDTGITHCGFIRDISEREKIEKERESERRELQAIIDTSPVMITYKNLEGQYIKVNKAFAENLGTEADKIIGKKATDFIIPRTFALKVWEEERDIMRTGIPLLNRVAQAASNIAGKLKWAMYSKIPFFDAEKKIIGIITFMLDITELKNAEQKIQESEKKLSEAHKLAKSGYWDWDLITNSVFWSEELCQVNGHDPVLPVPPFSEMHTFYTPESWALLSEKVSKCISEGKSYEVALEMIRPDGKHIFAITHGEAVVNEEGKSIRLFGTVQDITEQTILAREKEKLTKQLRELAAHLQNAREEERALISREIHDEMGQLLSTLKLNLSWLKKNLTASGDLPKLKISQSLDITTTAIKAIREINSNLRPVMIDEMGLLSSIELLTRDFTEHCGIPVYFYSTIAEKEIRNENGIHVYRIIQEAMNNSIKHAGASEINIRISKNEETIFIVIADNGKGFRINEERKVKTFGLVGMKERAIMLKGELKINTTPGKGTSVELIFPAFPQD